MDWAEAEQEADQEAVVMWRSAILLIIINRQPLLPLMSAEYKQRGEPGLASFRVQRGLAAWKYFLAMDCTSTLIVTLWL